MKTLFRKETTAEKLEKARLKAEANQIKNVLPRILQGCHMSISDGYNYLGDRFHALPKINQGKVLDRLVNEHGFIIMRSEINSLYAVFSDTVAKQQEQTRGWARVAVEKKNLPIPVNGEKA